MSCSLSSIERSAAHLPVMPCLVFLLQLLIISAFLLCEVVLQTNMLSYPYKWVLHQVLPDIYPEDADVRAHPYFASGLLFVSVATVVLFFASGMYSEKISYANRCVLVLVSTFLLARNASLRSAVIVPSSTTSPELCPIIYVGLHALRASYLHTGETER